MSLGFDWATFVISVSSSVFVALLIDWAKDTSRTLIKKVRGVVVKWWRG
jgi:hypothetical protein